MKANDVLALFISEKPVELKDVRVAGPLDLSSIRVRSPVRISNCMFEDAVDANDARFNRSVQFTNCTFEKGLRLAHARIDGPLDLSGSVLKPMAGAAEMPLHDLHVKGCIQGTRLQVECGLNFSDLQCGSAFRLHGASITGDLLLNSAYIEGELDLSDCESNGGEPAVQTEISGVLNGDCMHIESRLLLIGTRLGSARFEQAHVEGTMLLGPGRHTATQVELGVVVEAGKTADGCSLSLLGARLDGSLEIRGAKLHGALRVSNAKVGCYLLLTDAPPFPNALTTLRIPTSLGTSQGGAALRVTSTSVQGAMILENVEFGGAINASNSNVSLLEIDELCVTNLKTLFERLPADDKHKGVLALEGLTFEELKLVKAKKGVEPIAEDYLELLRLTRFDEGTYANVESWLRLSAKDDDADKVFRKMREEETARRGKGPKRLLYRSFGLLFGYGTRSLRGSLIWLATFAFSLWIFWNGSTLEETEKGDQVAVLRAVANEPTRMDTLDVVLRIQLPIIPWFSDPKWKPAAKPIRKWAWLDQQAPWLWLRYDTVANALLIFNLVNVTLIIASLSGLLKRRGS